LQVDGGALGHVFRYSGCAGAEERRSIAENRKGEHLTEGERPYYSYFAGDRRREVGMEKKATGRGRRRGISKRSPVSIAAMASQPGRATKKLRPLMQNLFSGVPGKITRLHLTCQRFFGRCLGPTRGRPGKPGIRNEGPQTSTQPGFFARGRPQKKSK